MKFHTTNEGSVTWFCPGCDEYHMAHVEPAPDGRKRPVWQWNRDLEKPTLSPSVKVTGGRASGETRCHVYIRDGKIQFLGDCTHALAGQTVDVPDWEAMR